MTARLAKTYSNVTNEVSRNYGFVVVGRKPPGQVLCKRYKRKIEVTNFPGFIMRLLAVFLCFSRF